MKLVIISESISSDVDDVLKDISKYISKPFVNGIVISGYVDDINAIKHILKRNKWYIHSANKVGDKYICNFAPINTILVKSPELYHITDASNVPKILKHGLVLGSMTDGMMYPKRIYFHNDKDKSLSSFNMASKLGNIFKKKTTNPVILYIDNSDLKYKTYLDPEVYMGMGANQDDIDSDIVPVFTTRNIDSSDISVILR